MTRNNWTLRVRRPGASPELAEVREAARDLALQGRNAPGRTRLVFQTVADVALIATAVISGALASVHLWKALVRPNRESHASARPEPGGAGNSPPRNRPRHAATSEAGDSNHRRDDIDRERHNQR